jgi:hypothetical protein
VDRHGLPIVDLFSQAVEQKLAKGRKFGYRLGGEVIPVQRIDPGPTGLLTEHETVSDQAIKNALSRILRSTRQPRNLAARPRLRRFGQDGEDSAVDHRKHRLKGRREIHSDILPEISVICGKLRAYA